MRLRKKTIKEDKKNNGNSNGNGNKDVYYLHLLEHTVAESEIMEYMFVRDVMKPLVGKKYVHPGVVVVVNKEFLAAVHEIVQPLRPKKRVDEASIDVDCPFAFLIPDLTALHVKHHSPKETIPAFSVEIKPKCGFLPVVPGLEDVKYKRCRFCMHQYLKTTQDTSAWGDARSGYCPLDLFSMDEARMKHAIRNLLRNPQNNLKIFESGLLYYAANMGGRTATSGNHPVDSVGTLWASFYKNPPSDGLESLINLLVKLLKQEDVLPNLLNAQKQDALDIQHIHPLYNSRLQGGEDRPSDVANFLIGATAKDCSMLITIMPIDQEHHNLYLSDTHSIVDDTEQGQKFVYSIGVVDLDPKPIENIPHYYLLDQKIVNNYKANEPDHAVKSCTSPSKQ